MQDTLHDRLVHLFCRDDGWQTGPWKLAFKAKCKENAMWQGGLEDEDGGAEIWGGIDRFNPDAWRFVAEGPDTPGAEWSYDVLVIEFLEVEISHPISLDKRRNYINLWWRFDGTSCFHMRGYRASRYEQPTVWLDTETAVREIAL